MVTTNMQPRGYFNFWMMILMSSLYVLVATRLLAQNASTSTTQSGQPKISNQIRTGDVVYVSGNQLVVKMDDGSVKTFQVPSGSVFHVDGKDMAVGDLKPGMHLTQTITTTTTPRVVNTVRTVAGTVWNVSPPKTVILTLPDGTNKQYNVPDGVKFTVDGQERTVFDLRKGMKISATVVTQSPEEVTTTSSTVTGTAPPPPPQMPTQVGVLLIEEAPAPATQGLAQARAPQPAPVTTTSQSTPVQPPPQSLPKTASPLPLATVVGIIALAIGFGLRANRRSSSRG